jgi:hypothetical protein
MGADTGVEINLGCCAAEGPQPDRVGNPSLRIAGANADGRATGEIGRSALAILRRFEVDFCILGTFTDTARYQAKWQGTTVVDLKMDFLWRACPIDPTPTAPPQRQLKALKIAEPSIAPRIGAAPFMAC